ncbi:MAG: restriction endonuclease subunit S [Spirochaetales bacterium]|nr:restriction endonuclease subunit S [Spirochaetales bacterium]
MSEWCFKTLKELCDFEKGITGIMKAIPGKYPLVTTGADRKTSNTFQFDAEAVCIPTISSAGHGKKSLNYIHYQKGKSALGTILVAVIPKNENELNTRYLHLYLQFFKDTLLVPLMKGTANVSLPIQSIKDLKIPVPPITEQKKLIDLIERIENEHEDIVNEHANQLLLISKLRQTVLQEAIEGKLTANWRKAHPELITGENSAEKLLERIKAEKQKLIAEGKIKKDKPLPPVTDEEKPFELPESWVWCRLGEITTIKGGKRVSRGYRLLESPTPFIYIRVSDMKNGTIDESDLRYISTNMRKKIERYIITKDDLYMTIVGATIGKCGIVPEKFHNMNLTENAARIILYKLSKIYLYYLLSSLFCQKQFIEKTKQVGVQKMALYRFSATLIPFPPLAEQKQIAEHLIKYIHKIKTLHDQVQERKDYTEQLMKTVLKEAFEVPTLQKETVQSEKKPLTPFQQMQIIGALIKQLEANSMRQGEMVLAKYLYLLSFVYGIKTGFSFKKWHFGPYDPVIRKLTGNRTYFKKQGTAGFETIGLVNEGELLKYSNKQVSAVNKNVGNLIDLFKGYSASERNNKIELMASVLKVVEDNGVQTVDGVYQGLKDWKTDKPKTGYANKAKKFSREKVAKCLEFMKKKGWV